MAYREFGKAGRGRRCDLVERSALTKKEWRRKRGSLRKLRAPGWYVSSDVSDIELIHLAAFLSEQEGGDLAFDVLAEHLSATWPDGPPEGWEAGIQ